MVAHSRTALRADRLRALNAPEVAAVELDTNGQPAAVRRSKNKGGCQVVESILDVWRIDDEWWRRPIARRYFEVLLDGGKRSVVFEDLQTGEWFLQQNY